MTRQAVSRIDYVDIAKALGMFTIIWGHIMLTGITNYVVYAFHIPLFFFLSGMMFRQEKYLSFTVFMRKRFRTLLIPYLIFSFVTWLIWYAYILLTHASVDSIVAPLLQTFIAQGSGGFLVHNVPLWFVTCLFVVEMLYYFIAKLPQSMNLLLTVVCAILGYFMMQENTFFDFRLLPWNIEVALCALPFYAIGNLLMRHHAHTEWVSLVMDPKRKPLVAVIALCCLVLLCCGAMYNEHVSMGSTNLGKNPLIFYLTAVCGVCVFIILCINLLCICEGSKICGFLLTFMKWFGRNSFDAMAIHNPIKGFVVVVVASLSGVTTQNVSSDYSYSLIAFVITLFVTSIAMWLINKIRACFSN